VPFVVAIAMSPLVTFGVFAIGNYITNTTTVTIDHAAWAVPVGGTIEYIPMCGFGSTVNCPYHVRPGSDFSAPIYVSGYFLGRNVSLSAPAPFSLVSTDPTLPTLVPSTGLMVTVDLGLPSTSGEYSFTGNVTFN